ncbi:MAG: glycosyltransferase [Brachybacterium sp.]|nr:glycosyltransferase [Brachybacterium sp.]
MTAPSLHLAHVCLHTSPLASPGAADAGGMNVVVIEQARALARRGHRIDLITRRSDPGDPDVVDVAPGIRLFHLDAGPAAPLPKSRMEEAIAPFTASLRRLLAADDAPRWDLIHSHHWFSGAAALDLARELRIPHLQSFHSVAAPDGSTDLRDGEPAESPGRVAGERNAAQRSDLVVAVSEAERQTIASRYAVDPARIAVARPGADIDLFHPGPDAHASSEVSSPDGPMVLFAARLQPLKAPDLALRTLARTDPEARTRLVLAGGTSDDFADYARELDDLAVELGIRDRVHRAGSLPREELRLLMREADLLLLPSWSETFGLVALEAQASGTPVIAWRHAGGIVEAIAPSGIVLEDRDPAQWAAQIDAVLADPLRHEAMRRDAEQRTWEDTACSLEEIYARTLAGTHTPDPWGLLDRARTVLVVHAHPDDETLATGPLLADLAQRGTRTVVLTATRGEEGEITEGALDDDERDLAEVRAVELARALDALGIEEHHMLGAAPALAPGASPRRYRDSGMRWIREGLAGPSEHAGEDSLTRRNPEEAVADLLALIDHVGADLLITYDDAGGYGHPDHVRVHEVTAEAAHRRDLPMLEVADPATSLASGICWREQPGTGEAVEAAVRAYATQVTPIGPLDPEQPGLLLRHVGGQEQRLRFGTGLRARPATGATPQ